MVTAHKTNWSEKISRRLSSTKCLLIFPQFSAIKDITDLFICLFFFKALRENMSQSNDINIHTYIYFLMNSVDDRKLTMFYNYYYYCC